MKAKDTVSKLDFGIPEIPDSRVAEFGHLEPDITDFVNTNNKGNGTFPKLDFSRLSVNSSIPEISNSRFSDFEAFRVRNHRFYKEFRKGNDTFPKLDFSRLSVNSSIPEIPNSRFSDFGYFEPDITDFVKSFISKYCHFCTFSSRTIRKSLKILLFLGDYFQKPCK